MQACKVEKFLSKSEIFQQCDATEKTLSVGKQFVEFELILA